MLKEKGDYIGSFAKYGYQKDPQNPKHLIIDPVTSKSLNKCLNGLFKVLEQVQLRIV